jgi:hypothetical protein
MQMLTGQRVALSALVVGIEGILFLTFSSCQALTLFNHLPGCRLVLYIRLGMSQKDFHFVTFTARNFLTHFNQPQREVDTTNVSTMIFLHGRAANEKFRTTAVDIAHSTVIPFLFNYTRANSTDIIFQRTYDDVDYISCRARHITTIVIRGPGVYTTGHFDESQVWIAGAKAHLATTIYVLMLWVVAEILFGRPVMHLVSLVRGS